MLQILLLVSDDEIVERVAFLNFYFHLLGQGKTKASHSMMIPKFLHGEVFSNACYLLFNVNGYP